MELASTRISPCFAAIRPERLADRNPEPCVARNDEEGYF